MSRRARSRAAAVAAKHVALVPLTEPDDEPDPELDGWFACPSCGAGTDPHDEDECWHCGSDL